MAAGAPARAPARPLLVHVDMKGAPPSGAYLTALLPHVAAWGATGLLMEWEDAFPFDGPLLGPLAASAAGGGYAPSDVAALLRAAAAVGLTVTPLVQTGGHLEFALKAPHLRHLREAPTTSAAEVCPLAPGAHALVRELLRQVVGAHVAAEAGAEAAPSRGDDVDGDGAGSAAAVANAAPAARPFLVHIGCDELFSLGRGWVPPPFAAPSQSAVAAASPRAASSAAASAPSSGGGCACARCGAWLDAIACGRLPPVDDADADDDCCCCGGDNVCGGHIDGGDGDGCDVAMVAGSATVTTAAAGSSGGIAANALPPVTAPPSFAQQPRLSSSRIHRTDDSAGGGSYFTRGWRRRYLADLTGCVADGTLHPVTALFLWHASRVVAYVAAGACGLGDGGTVGVSQSGRTFIPLMWHDMLFAHAPMAPLAARQAAAAAGGATSGGSGSHTGAAAPLPPAALAPLVAARTQLMVWSYAPTDVGARLPRGLWDAVGLGGSTTSVGNGSSSPLLPPPPPLPVWGAGCFRGASAMDAVTTPARHHAANAAAWAVTDAALEAARAAGSSGSGLAGLALTGWARFTHCTALCDTLPAGTPSLVLCAAMLRPRLVVTPAPAPTTPQALPSSTSPSTAASSAATTASVSAVTGYTPGLQAAVFAGCGLADLCPPPAPPGLFPAPAAAAPLLAPTATAAPAAAAMGGAILPPHLAPPSAQCDALSHAFCLLPYAPPGGRMHRALAQLEAGRLTLAHAAEYARAWCPPAVAGPHADTGAVRRGHAAAAHAVAVLEAARAAVVAANTEVTVLPRWYAREHVLLAGVSEAATETAAAAAEGVPPQPPTANAAALPDVTAPQASADTAAATAVGAKRARTPAAPQPALPWSSPSPQPTPAAVVASRLRPLTTTAAAASAQSPSPSESPPPAKVARSPVVPPSPAAALLALRPGGATGSGAGSGPTSPASAVAAGLVGLRLQSPKPSPSAARAHDDADARSPPTRAAVLARLFGGGGAAAGGGEHTLVPVPLPGGLLAPAALGELLATKADPPLAEARALADRLATWLAGAQQ